MLWWSNYKLLPYFCLNHKSFINRETIAWRPSQYHHHSTDTQKKKNSCNINLLFIWLIFLLFDNFIQLTVYRNGKKILYSVAFPLSSYDLLFLCVFGILTGYEPIIFYLWYTQCIIYIKKMFQIYHCLFVLTRVSQRVKARNKDKK